MSDVERTDRPSSLRQHSSGIGSITSETQSRSTAPTRQLSSSNRSMLVDEEESRTEFRDVEMNNNTDEEKPMDDGTHHQNQKIYNHKDSTISEQQGWEVDKNDDTNDDSNIYELFTRPLKNFLYNATFAWFFIGNKTWDEDMDAPSQFWSEFESHFNEEHPDVFEVCAVLRNDPRKGGSWIIFKCVICSFLQIIVSLIVISATVTDIVQRRFFDGADGSIELCAERSWGDGEFRNKIVAAFLSLYVSIQFFTFMRTYNDGSNAHVKLMYGEGKLIGLLGFFYSAGYFTNLIATCIAAGGSLVLIYIAADPIDMILNCTALFFIMELDDQLASTDEVKRARAVLKDMDKSSLRLRDLHWSFNFFKFTLGFVSILVWFMALVAPLYMFVCYGSSWKGDL